MPFLNSVTRVAAKPLPKMISPKTHAVLDYITVGAFLASAGWLWSRSKRAALASLICGGAQLAVSLLTDYPGGVKKIISFKIHRDIDFGLAAMTATMPVFLAFDEDGEKKFFQAQGVVISAATQLTEFPDKAARPEKGMRRSKAA